MVLCTLLGVAARYLFDVDWPVVAGLFVGLLVAPAVPIGGPT